MAGGYQTARFLHFWLAIGYVLFFLVHIAQVIRAGWNNFRAMVIGYEVAAGEDPHYERRYWDRSRKEKRQDAGPTCTAEIAGAA